jgi:effector-binding domain-containing protein
MMELLVLIALVLACVLLWRHGGVDYHTERSQEIAAPIEAVFAKVQDLRAWAHWSPWLIHDLQTVLTYHQPDQVGGWYSWKSERIGQGRVAHVLIESPTHLKMHLSFIKPFKSEADVSFDFETLSDGKTRVTWHMHSTMPFFMRPWLGMFKRMICLDYEYGLLRLASLFEPDIEMPHFKFEGVVERPKQILLAYRYSGSLSDLTQTLDKVYEGLLEQAGESARGQPMALFEKINLKSQTTVCDIATEVSQSGFKHSAMRLQPVQRYYKVIFKGHYRFAALARHNAMGHARMHNMRVLSRKPLLEVYPFGPLTGSNPERWVTEIYIPVA